MSAVTRPATSAELAWIVAPAESARVVAGAAELLAMHEREPWRIRVTERGEAAILGRWRAHLPYCAVLGVWCDARRVPVVAGDLLAAARAQGFERLVGPLAPEREAHRWVEAGLRESERVVLMRNDRPSAASAPPPPEGVALRDARAGDLAALLRLDRECFEPFWRYDEEHLERLMRADRVAVAESDGEVVGYTLSTSRAGDGGLGRLAVAPPYRRRGIGRALALEAVAWAVGLGARSVTLSTQEVNMASRALYRGIGFRETGDVLVVCVSDAPDAAEGAR